MRRHIKHPVVIAHRIDRARRQRSDIALGGLHIDIELGAVRQATDQRDPRRINACSADRAAS